MITKLSHATIFVEDQERALAFYTEKLGLAVKTDATLGDMRWLTVGTPNSDLEVVLMQPKVGPMFDEETIAALAALRAKGALGAGVWATDDCRKTHAELASRGVKFVQEPQERPYGIEALFVDDSGNWFSLTQRSG